MAYDKLPTRQLKVTLAIKTIDLLGVLMQQASHGTSVSDVAKNTN